MSPPLRLLLPFRVSIHQTVFRPPMRNRNSKWWLAAGNYSPDRLRCRQTSGDVGLWSRRPTTGCDACKHRGRCHPLLNSPSTVRTGSVRSLPVGSLHGDVTFRRDVIDRRLVSARLVSSPLCVRSESCHNNYQWYDIHCVLYIYIYIYIYIYMSYAWRCLPSVLLYSAYVRCSVL